MISIGKLLSADQVVQYLVEATRDATVEYYAGRADSPGRWYGVVAERLGLHGAVTSEQLRAVLDGRDPNTGLDLAGRRWTRQSVAAFDVTFSAPKSVSLLWALGDEATRAAVLRAHQAAVDAVCEYLQAHAGWGRRYVRDLGETVPVRAQLLMPTFLHCTSRPVTDRARGSVTVDPQLHTHIPIPNWVLREDGTWGQLHAVPLYRHAASAGAVGQAVLRDALVRELGVGVTVAANGTFEIAGITKAMRQEFSRRTHQVQQMDAAQGVETWHGHKLAVLASREGKSAMPEGVDLLTDWHERAARVGLDQQLLTSLLGREQRKERVVDVTIGELLGEHGLTAEAATFTRRDVVRGVATHSPLGAQLADLERAVDAMLADRKQVVALGKLTEQAGQTLPASFRSHSDEDRRYSTPEMVAIETAMLTRAQAGRLACRGIAESFDVDRAIERRPSLTAEQQTMVRAICRDGQAVTLVEGSAGSGKTYALAACRDALHRSGYQVVGAALSARAARTLAAEAGIPTATVRSLLYQLERGSQPRKTVIIVDEAAMVGSRQVAQLVEYAERDQAKLVLVGDRHQLHPIDGGAAFRALGDRLGTLSLRQNVRQAGAWEREALYELRQGSVERAVNAYLEHQAVQTASMREAEVRERLLADYRAAVERGRDAIMLAHRRADVAELNRRAHEQAAELGRLSGPSLRVGDGISGPQREFRAGDRVLFLENDHDLGITNGQRGTVIDVSPEMRMIAVRTHDDQAVRIDVQQYESIDHGYAMTAHKAQGHTADVCLVLAHGDEGREWTYTAMSRGREQNRYYTPAMPILNTHGQVKRQENPTELAARLTQSWSRSDGADSTLDYERHEEEHRSLVQKVREAWRQAERDQAREADRSLTKVRLSAGRDQGRGMGD